MKTRLLEDWLPVTRHLLFAGMVVMGGLVARQTFADVLGAWDVDGVDVADGTGIDEAILPYTFTAGTQHANVADAQLTLGAGVNPTTTADQYGFKISSAQSSLSDAITANHYLQFSVEAGPGYVLNLSSLEINGQSSGTGADDAAILNSVDGFASGNEIASVTGISGNTGGLDTDALGFGAPIDLSGAQYQGLSTITFRLYGWNTSSGLGVTYIRKLAGDDLVINGTLEVDGGSSLSAPSINAASQTNATDFTACWNAVNDADGYYLDVSTNDAFSDYQLGYQDRDVGNATTHTVTGLLSQTTYFYRVRAYDSGGPSAYSSTQQVITVLKSTPSTHASGFAVSLSTHRTIVLEWTDAVGGELPDGYVVRGSLNGFADIPVPVGGSTVPNSYTWGSGYYAHRVAQGTETDELTDLAADQTYYFKLFPVSNDDTNSLYKTDEAVPQLSATTGMAPFEDFEDAAKASYSAATVSLDSGDWYLDNAVLGGLGSDRVADQLGVRIRNLGMAEMQFDATNVEELTLDHANYTGDSGGKFIVERSIDGGSSWQQVGDEITCGDTVATASFTVHWLDDVRLRIRKTAVADDENRINIDNVRFTPYRHDGSVFYFR